MSSVYIAAPKDVVRDLLSRGLGLKYFTLWVYAGGTQVVYARKTMKFNVDADFTRVTYFFEAKTLLGKYRVDIHFFVVGNNHGCKVTVDVKGNGKGGYPGPDKILRSFSAELFSEDVKRYAEALGRSSRRSFLVSKADLQKYLQSVAKSANLPERITVYDFNKRVTLLAEKGKIIEEEGSLNDVTGEVLLVHVERPTQAVST
ncbi:MAG: hypothetical protein ACP5HQ_01700 [Thermoprotei archaeon]